MRHCGRHIEKGHAATSDAAYRENRVQHAGRVVVRCVAGSAGNLQKAVTAGQRLADAGTMPLLRNKSGV
jgi:hypothetical protein